MRHLSRRTAELLPIIKKIRTFQGLTAEEVDRLVNVGSLRRFQAGEAVFAAGQASGELLILLQGRLRASTPSGAVLAEIGPGTCTGEMGVFTGEPRSADVSAVEDSSGLVIRKRELEHLLTRDLGLEVKLLRNVVGMLAERLSATNGLVGDTGERRELQKEEPKFVYFAEGRLA